MKLTILHKDDLQTSHIPLPARDQLHIWLLSEADFPDPDMCMQILSEEECQRALRFAHEHDRLIYRSAHAALRKILGNYLNLAPETLVFTVGEHGKPSLPAEEGRPLLHFNLSHSGQQIALVFGQRPVGIDIEKIKSSDRILSLVQRFYHPEEYSLFSGVDTLQREELFYRYWTIREAFLKGLGTGLTLSSRSFLVSPDSPHNPDTYRITKAAGDYSHWRIHPVPAPEGYLCSVACTDL